MPAVSIILPTFNRANHLRETVASVFAQSWKDWELIVSDDGSDEATRAFIETLGTDERVRILWGTHSGIPAVARNAALRAARGEYVAFLDSDDLWEPAKLARQLERLRLEPSCRWCYTAFQRIDEDGRLLADESTRRFQPVAGQIFAAILQARASLRTPCVLAERQLVSTLGGFDETLLDCEDLDLWLRLALIADVAVVDEPLVRVRISPGSFTGRRRHARIDLIRVIEKLLGGAGPRWQGLLRRERAQQAVLLAREYADQGERSLMFSTLAANLRHAWPYPRAWYGALRALLRSLSPQRS
ncbi:MAG TPA: glycosyltransferase [Steroidobacteraceae bacterium]|nr:glycosyltransferase [Steroidobacteraceae bacterium]